MKLKIEKVKHEYARGSKGKWAEFIAILPRITPNTDESVFIPKDDRDSGVLGSTIYTIAARAGYKVSIRREEKGIRVWRT